MDMAYSQRVASGARRRRCRRHGTPPRGMDLISALPDELLLQILARLRCVGSTVQTSLISRRWRGLWTGLWVSATDLTFSGLEPATIEALFRRYAASAQVPTLAIDLRQSAGANSLLRAAVGLSPGHLIFTLYEPYNGCGDKIELPCFEGTTSIDLVMPNFCLELPLAGEFTALESLSVTGSISDLGPLLTSCPRLRELSVTYPPYRSWGGILRMPDGGEFPALEKLSLSGEILDTTSLINICQRVRELSVTQLDARPLRLMLPPYGEFPMLEKVSISGNIADLGILLNRCPRLQVLSVTLRGMGPHRLKAALTTLKKVAPPLGLVLDTLRIEIPEKDGISAARFASLLGAMERLSPKELVVPDNFKRHHLMHKPQIKANLPCFARATSIDISLPNVCFKSLKPAGEFSMLERLSLSRLHNIVGVNALVARCPRLRVLKATVPTGQLTIHSALLQKLDLSWSFGTECHGIDIVTPVLKKLHISVYADKEIGVSISAPMVENVLWQHSYTRPALVFGSWCLQSLRVEAMDMSYVTKREGMRSFMQQQQHPPFYALCLHLNTDNEFDAELNFAHEVEKLLVINFYMLDIDFGAAWHVYGALVLRLLRMPRIRAATRKLKIFLPFRPKEKQACLQNCACDKPKNWRSQSIFRTSLEEVEIHNSNGEDHEYDFLRLILKCSPMLKRVMMRYRRSSSGFDGCTTELSNISLAHPNVKFCN